MTRRLLRESTSQARQNGGAAPPSARSTGNASAAKRSVQTVWYSKMHIYRQTARCQRDDVILRVRDQPWSGVTLLIALSRAPACE